MYPNLKTERKKNRVVHRKKQNDGVHLPYKSSKPKADLTLFNMAPYIHIFFFPMDKIRNGEGFVHRLWRKCDEHLRYSCTVGEG